MSREAVKRVGFLGKPPKNREEMGWILRIAGRLVDRSDLESELFPVNVIRFSERRDEGGETSWNNPSSGVSKRHP